MTATRGLLLDRPHRAGQAGRAPRLPEDHEHRAAGRARSSTSPRSRTATARRCSCSPATTATSTRARSLRCGCCRNCSRSACAAASSSSRSSRRPRRRRTRATGPPARTSTVPSRSSGRAAERAARRLPHPRALPDGRRRHRHALGRAQLLVHPVLAHARRRRPWQREAMLEGMEAWTRDWHFLYIDVNGTGLLPVEAENQGKVVITTELGGGGRVPAPVHRLAWSGLNNVLRHVGVLEGEVQTRVSLGLPPAVILDGRNPETIVLSPEDGMFEALLEPGEPVSRGRARRPALVQRPARPASCADPGAARRRRRGDEGDSRDRAGRLRVRARRPDRPLEPCCSSVRAAAPLTALGDRTFRSLRHRNHNRPGRWRHDRL